MKVNLVSGACGAEIEGIDLKDTSDSNNDFQVLDTVSIPARSTLEVLSGQKYVLETTDVLRVKSGTASAIDCTLGIMEIT